MNSGGKMGTKNKITTIVILVLMSTLLANCNHSDIPEYLLQDAENITYEPVEQLSYDNCESIENQLRSIIERYLIVDTEIDKYELGIYLSSIFELSTEGASLFIVYDDYGNLEYFAVDIFGEMGRVSHSYTFTEWSIIYSVVEIEYSEPFFINPTHIPISDVYNNRYVIFNGGVYRFIGEGEYMAVYDELRDRIIERLLYFLEIIKAQ